jgi:hypothetical protein
MNNPMTGTDLTGYKALGMRKSFVGNAPCMGNEDCEYRQTFAGLVSDFRKSFSSGGAPFAGGPAKSGGGPIGPNVDLSGATDHISIVDDVLNNGAYREQILSTLGR